MRREVIMPHLEEAMEEGRVLKWLKAAGDKVEKGEPLVEIESAKATVEVESFYSGSVSQLLVPEGETVAVGTVIAVLEDGQPGGVPSEGGAEEHVVRAAPVAESAAPPAPEPTPRAPGVAASAETAAWSAGRAAPSVRRLAREHGIDLSRVRGSGAGGRILREDLRAWLAAAGGLAAGPPTGPSRIRALVAERMAASKATIPHFYVSTEVEMSRCLALHESFKARAIEVSLNDILLCAAVLALRKYPNLNATVREGAVCIHPRIDLCFAVETERGLLTPVIQGCEELSLLKIAAATRELIERARANRLKAKDLAEGTFTLTNLGMFGVTHFQAIINPPQVAILAVGAVRRVPDFDSAGRIVVAHRMQVTLSADHRATDGAEVARFLQELRAILEDGYRLSE